MKRSKMVNLITCYLNERENNGPLANITNNDDFANHLLTKIEEFGMAPPAYRSDIYIRAECDFAFLNEWEPENEP